MNSITRRLQSIERNIAAHEQPDSLKILCTFECPERGMVGAMFQGLTLERGETETEEAFKLRVQEFCEMEENL